MMLSLSDEPGETNDDDIFADFRDLDSAFIQGQQKTGAPGELNYENIWSAVNGSDFGGETSDSALPSPAETTFLLKLVEEIDEEQHTAENAESNGTASRPFEPGSSSDSDPLSVLQSKRDALLREQYRCRKNLTLRRKLASHSELADEGHSSNPDGNPGGTLEEGQVEAADDALEEFERIHGELNSPEIDEDVTDDDAVVGSILASFTGGIVKDDATELKASRLGQGDEVLSIGAPSFKSVLDTRGVDEAVDKPSCEDKNCAKIIPVEAPGGFQSEGSLETSSPVLLPTGNFEAGLETKRDPSIRAEMETEGGCEEDCSDSDDDVLVFRG